MTVRSGRGLDTFVHAHHLPSVGVDMLHIFRTVQGQREKTQTAQAALEGQETYACHQDVR